MSRVTGPASASCTGSGCPAPPLVEGSRLGPSAVSWGQGLHLPVQVVSLPWVQCWVPVVTRQVPGNGRLDRGGAEALRLAENAQSQGLGWPWAGTWHC